MNMLLVFKGHNGLHKKKITLVKYVAQIKDRGVLQRMGFVI